jgi:hypothetical protein
VEVIAPLRIVSAEGQIPTEEVEWRPPCLLEPDFGPVVVGWRTTVEYVAAGQAGGYTAGSTERYE